ALSLLGPADERQVRAAAPEDFGQEFLALVMSVRVVDSMDEAIEHIETHGSGHTEAIVTGDETTTLPPEWNSNGRVFYRQNLPLPTTWLAIVPTIHLEEPSE
ncbi:MAG: hypothetical protein IIA64_03715, partial [Planctomycetes bacterium]|nr:hypothetical protein [Planctomycetota bacterium]